MRQEMRQLLTPRMIQSMEILQLPLMALEERIEQEMEQNPVLEMNEDPDQVIELEGRDANQKPEMDEGRSEERALVVKEGNDQSDDFARLDRISEYLENEEFSTNQGNFKAQSSYEGERDKKLDAMNNTASRDITLAEHLLNQWSFIETSEKIAEAGRAIINYIDNEGYLRIELEQIQQESKQPLQLNDLREALKLIQTLEPSGVGARNLQECLLIQLDAIANDPELAEGHDLALERSLITDHLKD